MYTGVSLAWWHSYKWATKTLFRVFGPDILAPMFHHLYPGSQYSSELPSHTALTQHLSHLRLAYPLFKQELANMRDRHAIPTKNRMVLDTCNIYHLLEFFIPAVSIMCCMLYLTSHLERDDVLSTCVW